MDTILETQGIEFDELEEFRIDTENDLFIVTAGENGVSRLETVFGITPSISATLSERKSVLLQYIRGVEKLSGSSIRNIAIAYTNGETEVSFDKTTSTLFVEFTDIVGIPPNVQDLQIYLNRRKPAHIALSYVFLYNTHAVLGQYTHDYLGSFTHDELYQTDITP